MLIWLGYNDIFHWTVWCNILLPENRSVASNALYEYKVLHCIVQLLYLYKCLRRTNGSNCRAIPTSANFNTRGPAFLFKIFRKMDTKAKFYTSDFLFKFAKPRTPVPMTIITIRVLHFWNAWLLDTQMCM